MLSCGLVVTTISPAATKLNTTPISGGSVQDDYSVTPDSSQVVFLGDLTTAGLDELYSASTTSAGTQIKLNSVPVSGGNVLSDFTLSPDSSRAVYRRELTTNGVTELYSASTTSAGTQVKLNGTPVSGGQVRDGFVVTPDSGRAIYWGDLTTDNVFELYSASTTSAGTLNPHPGGYRRQKANSYQ